jgi:hypothetical protein
MYFPVARRLLGGEIKLLSLIIYNNHSGWETPGVMTALNRGRKDYFRRK